MLDPQGTTVLITGASSGIGYATALYLAGNGYSVIGTSRSMNRLKNLMHEAEKCGASVIPAALDINSDEAVQEMMPRLIDQHGGIDVLVNNAGYGLWGPVQNLAVEELRKQYETNFFAPFKLIKAVLPAMIDKRHGTIINISSVVGRLATPFNGAYASSKFALEGLSETMRTELWPLGVRVVVVEPGLYETEFTQIRAAESPDLSYQPYMAKHNERERMYDRRRKDPIAVAKVIHKVIRSKRPRFRYPVGIEAHTGILASRFLPERLFQFMFSRATLG